MARTRKLSRRKVLAAGASLAASTALPRIAIGQEKQPITMWIMDSTNKGPLTAILEQFKDQTGIDVTLQVVPWGQVFSKWTTSFAAGTGADVSQCGGMGLFPAIYWDQDNLADLSDVLDEIGPDNYFSSEWGLYKGGVTSVPWFLETRVLWYRKDWLEELGAAPPRTWDDLVSLAQAMTKDKQFGLGLPYMREFVTGQNNFIAYLNTDQDTPLSLAEQTDDGNLRITVDRDRFIEGLSFYTGLLLDHKVVPPSVTAGTSQSVNRLFNLDIVGMISGNGSVYSQIAQESPALIEEDKVGAVLTPGKSGPGTSFLGGSGLWLNKASKAPEEGKELLRYLTSQDAQVQLAKSSLLNQPSNKVAQGDTVLNENPFFSVLSEQLDTTKAYLWKAGPQPKLATFYGANVMEGPVLDVVVDGKTPVEAYDAFEVSLQRQLVG